MGGYASKAVYNILSSASAITDIVSTRIYPRNAPQNTAFPCIVYQVQSAAPTDSKDVPSDLDDVRVQIDCWAKSTASKAGYDQAEELQEAVRTAIDGITPGTYGTVEVSGIKFLNENDLLSEELEVYGRTADYQFKIKH